MREIGVVQCRCGYARCQTYWLTGIGWFVQSSGFAKEEAELIAGLLNAHYAREATGAEHALPDDGLFEQALRVALDDPDIAAKSSEPEASTITPMACRFHLPRLATRVRDELAEEVARAQRSRQEAKEIVAFGAESDKSFWRATQAALLLGDPLDGGRSIKKLIDSACRSRYTARDA